MNKNILIVLCGAVLAAVLVALLVQMTLGGKKPSTTISAVEILVAAQNIKKGDDLDKGDLRWQEWPDESLFKGAIIRKDDADANGVLKGRVERSFAEGEAIKRSDLIKEEGNYVAARLKAGERAVSVKLAAEDMVAGFITPGSYVDVILTYTEKIEFANKNRSNGSDAENTRVQEMLELNVDRYATETILENVRVLAVDQKAEQNKEEKIKVGKTITMAVTIRDAEKMTLASEMGRITLVMRGVGDDIVVGNEKTLSDARLTTLDDELYDEYLKIKKLKPKKTTDSKFSYDAPSVLKIYSGAVVDTISLD